MPRIKLRRLIILLATTAAFIVFVSLYLMVNKIDSEEKVQLEIRPHIDNYSNDKSKKKALISSAYNKVDHFYYKQAKVMCNISQSFIPNADIKLDKVYEKLTFNNIDGGVWKQGFDIQYSEDLWTEDKKLKVFVVPHSHTDPGWLKTLEQYYRDQTSNIFNNMVIHLELYPKMRFIYAESSFLYLWWSEIDENMKLRVKKLLSEKRLEFVTGGWVMTDEAAAHYWSMLDQMIEGTSWMVQNTGAVPITGWNVDSFGLSPTMAYLLKGMDFENMLIQRVHYSLKKHFSLNKQLEFNWKQTWDKEDSTNIFCHMMPFYSYDIPHTCGPDPKICCQFDFKRLEGGRFYCPWKIPPTPINDANLEERSRTLLDQYRKKSQLYTQNTVLVPLGDDFRYDSPTEWTNQYENYQKLFDYMNTRKDWHVEAKFATLTEYFEEVRRRGNKENNFPVLSGDFFTYADRDNNYWSGYFTSRPFYKKLDREAEAFLRSAEIIFSLSLNKLGSSERQKFGKLLETSRRNLALFQHHDGITGTAKDHVVIDYGNKLMVAINNLKIIIKNLPSLLLSDANDNTPSQIFDDEETRLSHDQIPTPKVIILDKPQTVFFYNPLPHVRKKLVEIYVDRPYVGVRANLGANAKNIVYISSQLAPVFNVKTSLENPFADISDTMFKLSFQAEIPALGFSSFVVEYCKTNNCSASFASVEYHNIGMRTSTDKRTIFKTEYVKSRKDIVLLDRDHSWSFDGDTGLLKSVAVKGSGGEEKSMRFRVGFAKYGTQEQKERSGAYLFLPDGPAKPIVSEGDRLIFMVVRGKLTSQVRTISPPHIDHCVTVTHIEQFQGPITGWHSAIKVNNLVDIRSQTNIELVMNIQTDIQKTLQDGFFVDLNGFQMQKRRTYSKLPIQGNIYPMTTTASIENQRHRLTVLSAQSSGVGNLETGCLQFILDRRLNQDDFRGLEQGVLDNKLTPSKFMFVLELRDEDSLTNIEDILGRPSLLTHMDLHNLLYPIHTLPLLPSPLSFSPSYSPLNADLPLDMHLINLRSDWSKERPSFALIVHRLAYNCHWPMPTFGSVSDGKIYLPSLFSKLNFESSTNVNLRLLKQNSGDFSRDTNSINIKAHEIKAVLLTFK